MDWISSTDNCGSMPVNADHTSHSEGIIIIILLLLWTPLWSSVPGYRSRGPAIDSRRHQIFWKIVGLELGPLSLGSIIEELLERTSSSSGLEIREYGHRNPSRWPRDTPLSLTLTSPKSCGSSVGKVRSRTQAAEFSFFYIILSLNWSAECFICILWYIHTAPTHYV
jgi:hypothetical protein